jgi:1-acyl-sn-glycerol-3-phosphate acyltransferase
MGDTFYRFIKATWGPPMRITGRPTIRGLEHIPRAGPFILASTHQSYFDVPILMMHTPRLLDFVSITEVFKNPLVAWFYGSLNAFPLDRSRADPSTVRTILERLERGRVVAMFPEGRIQAGEQSVLHAGRIRAGIGRIASIANVPIVPCVVLNSGAYNRVGSWAPYPHVRYALGYAAPIPAGGAPDQLEAALVAAFRSLYRGLADTTGVMASP